jgi:hypothetical protein
MTAALAGRVLPERYAAGGGNFHDRCEARTRAGQCIQPTDGRSHYCGYHLRLLAGVIVPVL